MRRIPATIRKGSVMYRRVKKSQQARGDAAYWDWMTRIQLQGLDSVCDVPDTVDKFDEMLQGEL